VLAFDRLWARLGFRQPPAPTPWAAAEPSSGWLLLGELGAHRREGRFIHLSDGGHLENMGVYELVRRRCRFIIATDVSEDTHAARQPGQPDPHGPDRLRHSHRHRHRTAGPAGPDSLSEWHCAVGAILYDEVDPEAVAGTLVYIRGSLTGDEPTDVRQYADTHPDFPNQTTVDQFFDEAQFEAYRALGDHIATVVFADAVEAMADAPRGDPEVENRRLFAHVRDRWFPPPPDYAASYTQASKMCIERRESLPTRS
jgi:hypothetical protein